MRVRVFLGQFTTSWERSSSADWNMRVFIKKHRVETALLKLWHVYDRKTIVGRECCNVKSRHIQLKGKFRLERSSPLGNEPRHARVYHRIEPDSGTDFLSDLFDGVIGKSRDIKILLDVAEVCSRCERCCAALQRPGEQNLSGGFVDALRNPGDHGIVGQLGFNTVTQRREGLHHDTVALAIVE